MGFSADFTAIDFETANRRRDSACQLAAVVVRQGEIVDERMWMIRPDPFFFSPGNIRIHGIHPEDVSDELTFGELWDDIAQYVCGDCLIAHNASFDIGVLIGCLERHRVPTPDLNFSCTRLIARQTWPERRRFGLKPLSDWLGVQFKHHDALEDSRACARVLLASGIARQADSLTDLEEKLRINRGTAGQWGVKQASRKAARRKSSPRRDAEKGAAKKALRRGNRSSMSLPGNPFDHDSMVSQPSAPYSVAAQGVAEFVDSPVDRSIDWQRVVIRAEFIRPLHGKSVVICGTLRSMSEELVTEITRRSGGTRQSEPDAQTDLIVIGAGAVDRSEIDRVVGDGPAEVLTESEFLAVIGV